MTTLRVLLAAPQALDRPVPWALFDASGRAFDRGAAPCSAWPSAERVEAVLAAAAVRMTSIELPPLAPSRLAAAAAFALEDQLAGPADAQHVAVSTQDARGRVVAVIAAERDVASLARAEHVAFARVIAEPDLAEPGAAWRWCTSTSGEGFVRLTDGSAFPVDGAADAIPPELAIALERAQRSGRAPAEIVVDGIVADAQLERWSRERGVRFLGGTPWRWDDAAPERFAAAVDLLQGAHASSTREAPARTLGRIASPALTLIAIATLVHVGAAATDWVATSVAAWRQAREWSEVARAAGVSQTGDPASAKAAIARRHAELRHEHGQIAASDALPLLARAAPAFAALPAGALRAASYADGHWTFDVARLDGPAFAQLDGALRSAGAPALAATSDTGIRLRVGAP